MQKWIGLVILRVTLVPTHQRGNAIAEALQKDYRSGVTGNLSNSRTIIARRPYAKFMVQCERFLNQFMVLELYFMDADNDTLRAILQNCAS